MTQIAQALRLSPLPILESRMLMQRVTGLSRVQLLTRDTDALTAGQLDHWNTLLDRRMSGEPMAYILGEREFYGRRFAVNPSVLIPRPETEHLVEAVLARLPPRGRVWDLGTGSGAVAVTVALERPDADVRASDTSAGALATAKANAEALGTGIETALGSWFDVDRPSEPHSYDIIVSNPPYIEAGDRHLDEGDLRFEPQNALTDFSDGLTCLRALAAGAPAYLKTGGWLLLEHGYDQGRAARQILADNGFTEIATLPDLAGLDRVTLGQWCA